MTSLELTQADLRVLSDAKYVFRNSGRLKKQYPQSIRDTAISIVEQCPIIYPQLSEELRNLQIEGIDPGEMILISATRDEECFYLATGDKRCLTALAAAPELTEIKQRLLRRVICLEQLILRLINTQGFDEVLTKVLPAREYDTALKAIFGSGERSTQENVMLALEAYIEDLRRKTEGLLVDF